MKIAFRAGKKENKLLKNERERERERGKNEKGLLKNERERERERGKNEKGRTSLYARRSLSHFCAQEWIRTITPLRALRPEHSASTSFATWAGD